MKKFMFAFATLALMTAAHAGDGTETKFNAELRARFWANDNPAAMASGVNNYNYQESHWEQRTKLGFTFAKGEGLSAHIGLLAANTWGADNYQTLGAFNSNLGVLNTGTAENFMLVHEAYGVWKPWNNFVLKIGRQGLTVADGTVLAANDWLQIPYAFDGVMGVWMADWGNVTFGGVKGMDQVDAATPTTPSFATSVTDFPDANFYGLSVDLKNLPEALKMVNVHALQSTAIINSGAATTTNGLLNTNSLRYGVTLAGNYSNFDYRGTYAGNGGTKNLTPGSVGAIAAGGNSITTQGSMFDVGVGYTFVDFMNTHLGVIFHSDTGDDSTTANKDESYDTFYYEAHNNGGMMDIVRWGNATYFKVGASVEPMDATKIGIDYYAFSRTTNKGLANFWVQGMDSNTAASLNANDSAVGTELDVYVTKNYNNGVSMNLFYGMFTPGAYLTKPGATTTALSRNNASQLGLEAKFAF